MRTSRPAPLILSMLAAPLLLIALMMLALPAPAIVGTGSSKPPAPVRAFSFVPRSVLP